MLELSATMNCADSNYKVEIIIPAPLLVIFDAALEVKMLHFREKYEHKQKTHVEKSYLLPRLCVVFSEIF